MDTGKTNPNDRNAKAPQAAFEDSLKRILSLPKEKIAEYDREHKPFPNSRQQKPPK